MMGWVMPRRKIKSVTAFAAFHDGANGYNRGVNPYWIRAMAKDVRGDKTTDWKTLHERGWRVVKVKVTPIGKPR
jgi:hypothetical protein